MRSARGKNVWGHSSVLVGVKVSREAVHDKAEIRGLYATAQAGHVHVHVRARTHTNAKKKCE